MSLNDLLFVSCFLADGAAHPCPAAKCDGYLEPAVVLANKNQLRFICTKCAGKFVHGAPKANSGGAVSNVERMGVDKVLPLTASVRVHVDASITLSVNFERATRESIRDVHSLLSWAEINADARRGYLQGARFGWLFAKVGSGWTVSTSRGCTAAKLVTTKLVKPRSCASCRVLIVKGEQCYAEGRKQPYGCRQHGESRWCVPCVERAAREVMPENVVQMNARRKVAT